jgi:uncharacterized protein (DUF4415 family)
MQRLSQTDWARVDALTDDEIDLSEVPELDESFFANAVLRMPRSPIAVTLHVDPEVLTWFKAQGEAYEDRVNAALRIYAEAHEAYTHTSARAS